MTKLSIVEKMVACAQKGETLPLEGRTRITLTDVHTGKREVFEDKNTVTNALSNIINSNYSGAADIARLMPLKQFFSGVMCFSQPIVGTPIAPPCETVNPMIANAGDESHSSASTTRGNPNGGEYVETDTSVKFVWDWQTNQGNGTISSVCLVPALLGNCGLKPVEEFDTFLLRANNESAKIITTSGNVGWGRNMAMSCPIDIVDDDTCLAIYIDGTTFEEITVKHDFTSFGILRGVNDYVEDSSRTATIRSRTANKIGICMDDDYYYVYEATSETTLMVDKISKSDMTVTTADLTLSGVSLWTGYLKPQWGTGTRPFTQQFGYDGKYLYFPDSLRTGMIRINLGDASDCARLTGTLEYGIRVGFGYTRDNSSIGDSIVVNEGLVYGDDYLVNGDNLYQLRKTNSTLDVIPVGQSIASGSAYISNTYLMKNNPAVWATGFAGENNYYVGRGLMVNRCALFTVNNLQAAIVKTTSQAMKIEYTLTQT